LQNAAFFNSLIMRRRSRRSRKKGRPGGRLFLPRERAYFFSSFVGAAASAGFAASAGAAAGAAAGAGAGAAAGAGAGAGFAGSSFLPQAVRANATIAAAMSDLFIEISLVREVGTATNYWPENMVQPSAQVYQKMLHCANARRTVKGRE
jgi:hypothetical protein